MKVSKEYLKFHEYNIEGSVENKWRLFKVSLSFASNYKVLYVIVTYFLFSNVCRIRLEHLMGYIFQ